MEGINGFLKVVDRSCGASAIEGLHLGGNLVDGVLKLLHALPFARQEGDGQRTNFLWQLFLQHRQRRVLHRGHKHPLALGKVVADDVGDGVRFACAGWTLHDNTIGYFQQLDDAYLLVIEGFREI